MLTQTLSKNTKLLYISYFILGLIIGMGVKHELYTKPANIGLYVKQEMKFQEGFDRGMMCMSYRYSSKDKGIDVPSMDTLCDQYLKDSSS